MHVVCVATHSTIICLFECLVVAMQRARERERDWAIVYLCVFVYLCV